MDSDFNVACRRPVDVVVAVYNAPDDVAQCVESVLRHTRAPYRLVLIDDASPDPAIGTYFRALEARSLPQVVLLRNEENLGFTGTANRGMQLAQADVVLLNSDTIVTAGWLDALVRCATSRPDIGTVTPFSNNAEICSFPRFCEDNRWPEGADPEPVRAALERAAVPTYPDLPTGVGFCLYVRRELIDAIGVFDPAFGRGYGEENDFCLRAVAAGFRNVLCDDAFVLHTGERSFAGMKTELGARNMALLLERHPHYLDLVREFIAADPLRPLRDAAAAGLRARAREAGVLHVLHGHGGGTEHHVRALIDASRGRFRHYLAIAIEDRWQVEEHLEDGSIRSFELRRNDDEPWPAFLGGLCATLCIGLVHLHNISGCRDGILAALAALPVPYGYTVHDLNFACPTITFLGPDGKYCGAPTDAEACRRCLAAQPEFAGIDIAAWRARHRGLLSGAAFLIAPAHWTAATLRRYFPEHEVEVIAHGAPTGWAAQKPGAGAGAGAAAACARMAVVLPDDDVPTVAVLGAIGPDKGARRLDRLVDLARDDGARLRFVLIGYLDRLQMPWQSDDALFTVHGRYASRDLPDLLAHYRAALVVFPSAGPETFSLTLSEAWQAGRPVLVPPIGALAERVAGTGAGWVLDDEEWSDEARMLERIATLVAPGNAASLAAAAAKARALALPTPAGMAEKTLVHYRSALTATSEAAPDASTVAPFTPERVRDALGYVPWSVPASGAGPTTPVPSPGPAAHPRSTGVVATVAKLAMRLGPTPPGRVLRRVTPVRILDALKARLP